MIQNPLIKMKNNYTYGEDFEMDEIRASKNFTKVCKGKVKRKKKVKKLANKFTAWKTP